MKIVKSSYSVVEIKNGHKERAMRSRHRGGHGPQISDLNEKGEMP